MAEEFVSTTLLNLVPPAKQDHLAKKLEYEVLVFYTKLEYETCELESEFKKKIFAKFRDYNYAMEFANRIKFKGYHLIMVRA